MTAIERLREETAELRRENAQLKSRLETERSHLVADRMDRDYRLLEIERYKGIIREKDENAAILVLHDELTQLNLQCALYADALEEVRENFVELRRLYSELCRIMDVI